MNKIIREKNDGQEKWVTFTYTGSYIRKITTIFKDTDVKVAFKTNTIITKLLNSTQIISTYEQSGIYEMTCQSCQKSYIGQTGRNLMIRYKEHIRTIQNNKEESAFTQHTLNTGHQYSPIERIMKIIEHARKGRIMDIKENVHIY
jgi:ferritin-like metal-binding protein YciE